MRRIFGCGMYIGLQKNWKIILNKLFWREN